MGLPSSSDMTDTAQNAAHDFIAKTVETNDVVLFMKGTPDAPQCGFSAVTVQILDHLGADFVGVNGLQSADLRYPEGYALRLRGVGTVSPDATGKTVGKR